MIVNSRLIVNSYGYIQIYYFFCKCYRYHRDLHVLTHSFPTRRSADLRSFAPRRDRPPARRHTIRSAGNGAFQPPPPRPYRSAPTARRASARAAAGSLVKASSGIELVIRPAHSDEIGRAHV